MTRLIGAEWLKLSKRWMPRILTLVLLVIVALLIWGIGASSATRVDASLPRSWITGPFLASSFAPFLWPILGGAWAGSEFGWGTIRMVLSRRPQRGQFVFSQISILVIAVGLTVVAVFVVSTIGGVVVGLATSRGAFAGSTLTAHFDATVVKNVAGAWYILAYYVVLGYAFGSVARSGSVGIGAGLGFSVAQVVVGGIFANLGGTWRTIEQHFPYMYTSGLSQRLAMEGTSRNFISLSSTTPGVPESIVGIAIYLAVLVAATLVFMQQRDVTA